jgi:hypothetical protein
VDVPALALADEADQPLSPDRMSRLSSRRVVHLQLAGPPEELPADDDGRGVYAIFWVGDLPVGHQYFDAEELPIGPSELGVIAADSVAPAVARRLATDVAGYECLAKIACPLRALETGRATPPEPGPTVSVVVLAGDDPHGLDRCLASLERSSAQPEAVAVVDAGAAHAATSAVVGSYGHTVRLLGEAVQAHSDVIAFTDDRCTVHPSWLDALATPFREPRVGAVSGLVLAAELETQAQVAFERVLGGLNLGFIPLTYAAWSPPSACQGSSANLAVRAAWFRDLDLDVGSRLGRDALDRLAAVDLWSRLRAAGMEGRYEPAAVVLRRHRRDRADVVREARRPATSRMASGLLYRAARGLAFGTPLERRLLCAQLAGRVAAAGNVGSRSRAAASVRAAAVGEQWSPHQSRTAR